jgi:hypothetical protein
MSLWVFNYDYEFALTGRKPLPAGPGSPWHLLNHSALWLAPLLAPIAEEPQGFMGWLDKALSALPGGAK